MHLIYFDESGNTGTNLNTAQQPIFVLGALIVPETGWLALEIELHSIVEKFFPSPRVDHFEIHASELHNARDFCKSFSVSHRLEFRDEWFRAAQRHGIKFIYRAIVKKRFQAWVHSVFGAGVAINPHVAAFPIVARAVDTHLQGLGPKTLGMFISDENKDVVRDVEKAHKLLRGTQGALKLKQIIEKGFFIDSASSLPLQLCDLCVYAARKKEEQKAGIPVKPLDASGVALVDPLILRMSESLPDVLAWLEEQQKKVRPGN
ncbi:MAG TPA: DUF3800 domain-containing protein [Opitutaceae bacterium]|nr:DUF3800 domain-containing protein [Opitutaceae bacterium]HVT56281.1 DUF3800 domain-containing protein [Xanthobacteraceae bacterium]